MYHLRMQASGTYPFGAKLRAVVQQERRPKRVFVLGVYASAVHAKWIGPDGRQLVRALAVASEPTIFWDGSGAEDIVSAINVPPAAGRLEPAEAAFNGPSGCSMDRDFLEPLGLTRADAWLCDLVPHTCLNPSQLAALRREYEPRRTTMGLPDVDLPSVPTSLADDTRRREILVEIEEAKPDVIVLLGDKPIQHFLMHHERQWRKLSDFGIDGYGRVHEATIAGTKRHIVPLAHPRQAAALGRHSTAWRERHGAWKVVTARGLLGGA